MRTPVLTNTKPPASPAGQPLSPEISKEYLLDHYSGALKDHRASMLVGAGLSRAAELADWHNLLRSITTELHLEIDKEHDLVAVAQYHVNMNGRAAINRLIMEEFLKDVNLTENHHLIAALPLSEVWTTNYDTLLEDAFRVARKLPDVKRRAADLSQPVPKARVVIYKMHGDAKDADEAVITKDDYERYNDQNSRQSFSLALQGHLVSKSFLFLGFSFTDPNIEYILSRVRALVGSRSGSEHFCIMKRPTRPSPCRGRAKVEYARECVRLEHRIRDLKRFNINTHLVDTYGEVTRILRELNRRQHLWNIFVSGSAEDYSPLGRDRIEALSYMIGSAIIENGFNVVSGFGLGIGGAVVTGAVGAIYHDEHAELRERATLLPFPRNIQDPAERKKMSRRLRTDMLAEAGFAIFIGGNNKDNSGKVKIADGVVQEFNIAKEKGVYPIPIGATGHAAAVIWKEVMNDLKKYYGNMSVSDELQILNNPQKSNEDYIRAIFSIIRKAVNQGGN